MTPASVRGVKESLQLMYASCLGLQFKILRDYPNTVQQILDGVAAWDNELCY